MQSSSNLFQLHPQELFTQNSCQTFGIFITFLHELVFFFIIFLFWQLLNDDIYTMHMFSLKLASFV